MPLIPQKKRKVLLNNLCFTTALKEIYLNEASVDALDSLARYPKLKVVGVGCSIADFAKNQQLIHKLTTSKIEYQFLFKSNITETGVPVEGLVPVLSRMTTMTFSNQNNPEFGSGILKTMIKFCSSFEKLKTLSFDLIIHSPADFPNFYCL